ncbi:hypothetical protein C8R47DRAFT_1071666 [Mycena vitilis]|nr:hypothetical protein C8R47DRAFT_1071666 [Mycena vitilis]
MAPRSKAQAAALQRLNGSRNTRPSLDDENTPPADLDSGIGTDTSISKKSPSLRAQIIEKEDKILQLEATVAQLSADLLQLQKAYDRLSSLNQTLVDSKKALSRSGRGRDAEKEENPEA